MLDTNVLCTLPYLEAYINNLIDFYTVNMFGEIYIHRNWKELSTLKMVTK